MLSKCYKNHHHYFLRKKLNIVLITTSVLYCSFFPVIQILVVQEVRDVLFSVLLMYAIFLFYVMTADSSYFFKNWKMPFLSSFVLVLAIMARNNNAGTVLFVAVVIVAFIVLWTNRKTNLVGASIFAVSTLALYIAIGGILSLVCQPLTPATEGASMSIMSQTIARAYIFENNSWTDEEKETLSAYMDIDGINYYPENADETKFRLQINGNSKDFLAFWFKMGLKYPGIYVDAILANTQNMWYPDSVIDGYKPVFTNEGDPYYDWDKCYYNLQEHLEFPAEHINYLPVLYSFYQWICLKLSFEKIPVISMLFSIGFQFWLVVNCLLYLLYRRLYRYIFPIVMIFAYMIIAAFVPLVLLRYFAALFFLIPLIYIFTINPSFDEDDKIS